VNQPSGARLLGDAALAPHPGCCGGHAMGSAAAAPPSVKGSG